MTPAELIEDQGLKVFNTEVNKAISMKYGEYFSASAFKAFVEKDPRNFAFKSYVLDVLRQKSKKQKIPTHLKVIVNTGLGWDTDNYSQQMSHVKNFMDDVRKLGVEVIFLSKFPYAPLEQNIESIKPQLKNLLRNKEDRYILMSLCKGTPELLIATAELVLENPQLKSKIAGFMNMSGMLGGTFFSSDRLDIKSMVEMEKIIDNKLPSPDSFVKYDREQTIWSLPYISNKRIEANLRPVLKVDFGNIPAINVSGAIMSDKMSKRSSPLQMFLIYNQLMNIYSYGNDGFIDVTQTRLPKNMFKNQKSLVIDGSHLLVDGYLAEFDLSQTKNRELFYRGVFESLLMEIK